MPTVLAASATLPASRPTDAEIAANLIFTAIIVVLALGGLILAAVRYKALRPSKVAGPERTPWPLGVWPLWVALGISFILYFIVTGLLLATVRRPATSGSASQMTVSVSFEDEDMAMLSVVPPAVCFGIVTLFIALIQPGLLSAIGLSKRSFPRGLKLGLLAALVIVPWVFLVSQATDIIYRMTDFQHPEEHELLKVMTTPKELYKWLAILGAVLVAPIWEEFFFRGLLQTAITESLLRMLYPYQVTPSGFPVVQSPQVPPAGPVLPQDPTADPTALPSFLPPTAPPGWPPGAPLQYASPPPAYVPQPLQVSRRPHSRALAAWISILITSTLFALVHPLWTAPIIFFLAVGLGYVYERSGKLWVPMTVHAAFNIISTILYLSMH